MPLREEDFNAIIAWLIHEREVYQSRKWDYAEEDEEHALQGLDADSWAWQRGVENYAGRVRVYGVTSPNGIQAYLKLIATLIAMVESLLRSGAITELPQPGHPSGEIAYEGR